jgi:hypothetical protein
MIAAEAIVDRKYLIAPSPNLSFVGLELFGELSRVRQKGDNVCSRGMFLVNDVQVSVTHV